MSKRWLQSIASVAALCVVLALGGQTSAQGRPIYELNGSYVMSGSGVETNLPLHPAGTQVLGHTGLTGLLEADGRGVASIKFYSNVSFQSAVGQYFLTSDTVTYTEGGPDGPQ